MIGDNNQDRTLALRVCAERYCNGSLSAEQTAEFERDLNTDPAALDSFLLYMEVHSRIAWNLRALGVENQEASEPIDALPALSTTHYPLPTSFVGGPVFSYMVATVVLCLMLLGAWAYKINHISNLAFDNSRRPTATYPSKIVFVGKITGMNDCRWSDPDTQTILGASVTLDRQYALSSGLMEITYANGARVILEGPCTYKVDSSAGGYLTRGKLTARVEAKGSGFGGQDSKHSPLSTLHSPLFAVRTPTALVTDLGTEFGVEVNANGDTVSHVFQGSIKVQGLSASADSGASQEEKVLQENESIRVSRVRETHHKQTLNEPVRFTHPISPPKFVRRMPQWTPIEVFNTGIGLEAGDADPHWRIVARSDEPDFQPRQAVVVACDRRYWLYNQPWKSQWISLTGAWLRHPHVEYTFRTTFDLTGLDPATAKLSGKFIVDNHISAIRLNGVEMPVPDHPSERNYKNHIRFSLDKGFVAGINVLDFVVDNSGAVKGEHSNESEMGLRVELVGGAEQDNSDSPVSKAVKKMVQ